MVVVSYGAGTNSTTLIIEMIRRGEPIDLIEFADTGGERPTTYEFLALFSEWVKLQIGIRIEIVRDHRTLEDDCLIRKALPSVVYGRKSCSLRFKRAAQRRYLRQNYKGIPVTSIIGFDAGEPWRAAPIEGNRYPLIEWGIDRKKCLRIIDKAGLPQPGKSSCFFCPNMKKHEILALPPELQDRAISMERNAKLDKMVGLGRTWRWEDLILSDRKQVKFNFRECQIDIPCECYDG